MRALVLVLILACAGASAASAQTLTDERVWVGLSVQARPRTGSPWRATLETQIRSREGVEALEQWYLRPSVARDLSTRSSVWAGYAFFRTTPASGGVLDEHRFWQQFLWTRTAAGGTFSSRSRLEQRMLGGNDALSWRLRQQLRFMRPLRARSRLSAVLWDEFSAHLNTTRRTARGFDQNRAFAGLSAAMSPQARVEFGYQIQFVHASTGPNRLNHVLSGVLQLTF